MALIKSISGIRGTIGGNVGSNLTPIDIVKFTSAFVTLTKQNNPTHLTFIVGRDARVSGEMVNQLVCATLQSMGVNVVDLGLSTTPTVEMAVIQQKADGGIILTASHNPMQWNALKLLNQFGEFISAEEGRSLLDIAEKEEFTYSTIKELGTYTSYSKAIDDHIEAILKLDLVDAKAIRSAHFSVVLDAVNSTGGIAIPRLLDKLGVKDVTVLYGEPTGIFPHNPEPLPEHLTEISEVMRKGDYHIGFVVDPDVDRLAFVMENGEMFGEEYTLVAVADYVLQNTKGNTVSNLSSSRALHDISEKYGVSYRAAAVGEVNVVNKMKETDAIIGGEGNGGIIYPELHYGRDALVGIALFLSSMAKSKHSCSEIRRTFPEYYISKNKIELSPDMDIPSILNGIADKYNQHDVNSIDGVKIDFPDNWVHLRASNTEPIIRIYAEAFTMGVADNLAKKIMGDISEFVKTKE
jgi:phosphomannomutase